MIYNKRWVLWLLDTCQTLTLPRIKIEKTYITWHLVLKIWISFTIFLITHLRTYNFTPLTQNLEVVPLFGDMQIAPFNYIKRSKNFDCKMWPMCSASSISPQADLMCHLPRIRDEHIKYISELARYSNEVRECASGWGAWVWRLNNTNTSCRRRQLYHFSTTHYLIQYIRNV